MLQSFVDLQEELGSALAEEDLCVVGCGVCVGAVGGVPEERKLAVGLVGYILEALVTLSAIFLWD